MSYKHPPKKLACYLERRVHERSALIQTLGEKCPIQKIRNFIWKYFSRKKLSSNCVATRYPVWVAVLNRLSDVRSDVASNGDQVLLLLHAEVLTFYWNLADWGGGGGCSSFYDLLFNRTPWDAVARRELPWPLWMVGSKPFLTMTFS